MHSPSPDPLGSLAPEERLHSLGIELPPAAPAVGAYAPTVITGNLLMTSGQSPWIAGDLKFKGKLGAELNVEQGYQGVSPQCAQCDLAIEGGAGQPRSRPADRST